MFESPETKEEKSGFNPYRLVYKQHMPIREYNPDEKPYRMAYM